MSSNANVVKNVRTYLRGLAKRRSTGVVTADDVRTYLKNKGMTNLSTSARISLVNSAFQGGDFRSVGQVPSMRPEARGRMITEWTI